VKVTKTNLAKMIHEELDELLGEPKPPTQPMHAPPAPVEVFNSVRELWPDTESTEAEKIDALENIWRLLDKALVGTGKQPGLLQLGEAWWKEEIPKPTLPDFSTPERVQQTADKYEAYFGSREGAPVEIARDMSKLYELVAQELEKRMSGKEIGRISKSDLTEAITDILSEHAKDYIWGTTNAPVIANQYGWRRLKGNCDE